MDRRVVAAIAVAAYAGTADAASGAKAREFLGQAAFGLQQVDVALAALMAFIALFVISTISRRYWLFEVGFLLLVVAGLISNAIGMIALTMVSLFSMLILGWIFDNLGFSAELTSQEMRRVEAAVDASIRDDLGADPKMLRAGKSSIAGHREPGT